MEAVGAGLAVYGRVKARKNIRRTKPGGLFNPNAEVRKAKPAKKFLGIFLIFTLSTFAIPYPSHVWYENPIKVTPIVDDRPFFIRLLDSLWVSVSILPIKGEIKGQADF
jgi:hypothetical protein